MSRLVSRLWPLVLGLAALLTIAGGSMWLANRASKNNDARPAALARAPASSASLPALDLAAPTNVETATFSMG